ncbi:MAG: dTMP kinase [candidate division Zixibacteria bacterium]|nr:dTMP kinase [candidate division Zixibacteria bacterium]
MRGKLITLEGIDLSGKSTQAKRLFLYLKASGRKVILLREPGGTRISEQIRRILLTGKNLGLTPQTELLLYLSARAQLVSQIIRPALESGKIVICDRFYDSTTAYQGYGRGIKLDLIHKLNRFATGGITPHLTMLFDLPVQSALKRATSNRIKPDRMEREGVGFHKRVRNGFLSIAKKDKKRFKVIESISDPNKTWKKVQQSVDNYLKAK